MSKKKSTDGETPRKREASQDAYEKFVKVWNEAESKDEVVSTMGLSPSKVNNWSGKLRAAGVPLKKFTRTSNIDFDTLKEIAKKALRA
jgi:hypothetical protein